MTPAAGIIHRQWGEVARDAAVSVYEAGVVKGICDMQNEMAVILHWFLGASDCKTDPIVVGINEKAREFIAALAETYHD